MHYILYQITNKLNSKIYVGVHKTKDLDDGYMGSGKVIRSAIQKYGIENFDKRILQEFSNPEEMFAAEAILVTDEFLDREDVYNLRRGGSGGFDYINRNNLNGFSDPLVAKKGRKSADLVLIERFGSLDNFQQYVIALSNTEEIKNKRIETRKKNGTKSDASRMQTEEANIKRKETFASIGHSQGEKNSQFNKRWIYNLELKISKTISKYDPLPLGWLEGRKMKWL